MSAAVELNAESLDGLVLAHITASAAKAGPAAPEEELRHLLRAGDFRAAATRLAALCPALASSQWLQFQLKKHQFMHLAALAGRGGSSSGEAQAQQLQEALELARRELAPLALHAYCEAYSDFKRCMLALVSQSSGGSGGTEADAAEASPELEDFAGMLARAVRQENGGYSGAQGAAASQLPKLLRYLLLLHQHQAHSGFHPYWWPDTSPAAEALCQRLLLPRCDALPPPALEAADGGGGISSLGASSVREHDVQALRTSLGCDREETITLLRRARGNASVALQDALAAAHLDKALLRELSEEYAACRGLEPLPPAGSEQDMSEAEGGSIASQTQQPSPKRQRRPLKAGGKGGTGAAGGEAAQQESEEEVLELPAELSEQQLRRLVRQLERLLTAGEAEAALQQLEAADTSFLPDHPAAAFALHRCCFLEQLLQPAGAGGGGGTTAALAVVRQHLSPLAQQHPDLQPQLKATLALLLPLSAAAGGDDAASQKQQQKGVADALTALRAALRPRCRVREPRLLVLLRELLSLHAAHFKLQRCQDRFAAELGIPALKASPSGASAVPAVAGGGVPLVALAAAPAAAAAVAWPGAGEVPVPGVHLIDDLADMEEGDSDDDEDDDDEGSDGAGVPEQAILTVCEFTGLPRHAAIDLLMAHGGDAASVLAAVFP